MSMQVLAADVISMYMQVLAADVTSMYVQVLAADVISMYVQVLAADVKQIHANWKSTLLGMKQRDEALAHEQLSLRCVCMFASKIIYFVTANFSLFEK